MIERTIFTEEHEMWRETVRRFVEKPALAFLGARLLVPRRAVSVG